ncbi:MAG: V-type ATP synthase subunit D [Pseudomonadota bacterium]
MARLQLSKTSLTNEKRRLEGFERFLPSLDLKRRQLTALRAGTAATIADLAKQVEDLRAEVADRLPMLANTDIDLNALVHVSNVQVEMENVVGVRLPRLSGAQVDVRPYSYLGKPHWVDQVAEDLKRMVDLRLRLQVEQRRLELLAQAVRTVTQRVNLFDKVLIPRTRANIKRIEIYLSDAERAAVVRAKIAKAKHHRQAAA